MMTDRNRIYEFADKWLKGTLTEKEKQEFEDWYNQEADFDQVMAWQKGFFEFDNTELPAIMQQISQWYDVDVRDKGQPGSKKFGEHISTFTLGIA
jgi:anti-sigma-K factor RskA